MATPARVARTNRFGDSSRFYETDDGKFPSVTTILGCAPKPALVPWAAKQEREAVIRASADLYEDLPLNVQRMSRAAFIESLTQRVGKVKAYIKEVEKATEIGSSAHERCEWINRKLAGQLPGPEPRCANEALWASMAYEDWLSKHNVTVERVEQVVWHGRIGYAGTLDFLGTLDGVPTLFDIKTSKAIYAESHLQVAAYAKAYEWMGHGRVKQGCIVRLPKKTSDPQFEVSLVPDLDKQFKAFLGLLRVWRWQESLKGDA